jgi:hypothetical protein
MLRSLEATLSTDLSNDGHEHIFGNSKLRLTTKPSKSLVASIITILLHHTIEVVRCNLCRQPLQVEWTVKAAFRQSLSSRHHAKQALCSSPNSVLSLFIPFWDARPITIIYQRSEELSRVLSHCPQVHA